eukprot:2320117-Pyramimonas_sp.AAC.1
MSLVLYTSPREEWHNLQRGEVGIVEDAKLIRAISPPPTVSDNACTCAVCTLYGSAYECDDTSVYIHHIRTKC